MPYDEPDVRAALDLGTLARFCEIALTALAAAREEIDSLNVYPVPDGDTGTNMFLTFESARDALVLAQPPGDLAAGLAGFARGALMGARGNSGVILAQLMGAMCRRLGESPPQDRAAAVVAEGLVRATEAAYAAVGVPVEGTILSVARAASDAAQRKASEPRARLGHVVRAAAAAAREALARTPEQLQVLRDAGVVDAGGRGLCVILDAAETAVTGRRPVSDHVPIGTRAIAMPLPTGDLRASGPAYEVMFLLDAADAAIPTLKQRLAPLGDSLVVIGGEGLWNVHVHVDDVGAAVEAGIEAGRPHRIRVTHFAEQDGRWSGDAAGAERQGRKVVVVAAGSGLAELFGQAGAVVLRGGPGSRPSTAEVLEAITGSGAAEVVVLPNDRDSVPVAEAAAQTAHEELGLRVRVIATSTQVQGLAALAVHEPGRGFDQDVLEMTAAARHARSGGVTVAARRAMTTAGPCEPGDVLGAIEGDFTVVGADLFTVAVEVLERLLGGGGELVTLVTGQGAGDLPDRCSKHLASRHPMVDVVVYDGGQDRYPLLVGVE
ncbi:DAK2 domain-containing protein [Nocardioides mesophilus]|uniref:DAK2 domain-containing protein n=1 Tax=Nocardioides mesophilus TaxID=433659 RepID=A0A7G9R922_9ACTN|nr:DAK2 domain-containing protein [Nocardioides mesophilus]QNN52097.1 DAK2 domain-containing protein [Nocardioides mesophilus]